MAKKKFSFPVKDTAFQTATASSYRMRCVAVAKTKKGVAVRDTKDSEKNTMYFTHDEWAAFIDGAKKGEFD